MPSAIRKNLNLDLIIANELPELVDGDALKLQQILSILIDNAIKFTTNGHIRISAEPVVFNEQNITIRFSVNDTGIGMSKEKITAAFENLTPSHFVNNGKYGGSGLGISNAKRLVAIQNGTIKAESTIGLGATFTFSIPYLRTEGTEVSEAVLATDTVIDHDLNKQFRILVVEDNVMNQELMNALLSDWGFEFDIVENGEIALKKLQSEIYDLILMDIQMPEMGGYEATEVIREKMNLHIPIIAISAYVMPGEKEKCFSAGMNDYLTKPFNEKDLLNLILKYCNRKPSGNKNIQQSDLAHSISEPELMVSNLIYLRELSGGKQEFVNRMIRIFIDEITNEVQQLDLAIQNRDFKSILHLSHKIKSTILFAGLEKLLLEDLILMEDLATENADIDQIELLFKRVNEICRLSVDELTIWKSKQSF